MATIQWFPGHMSKARRQVQENIKFVDFVTILVDARLPLSSQNPMLTKIVGDKPKLLILNKADLADSDLTKEWRRYFESQGIKTLAINSKEQSTVKKVTEAAQSLMKEKIARQKERGIQIETLRTMIIGIPNAGKSTLMNRLAGKKIAVDMTQKLGFRDDYDRFYRLFIKDIRDGKLGRYTLDTLGEIHGDN